MRRKGDMGGRVALFFRGTKRRGSLRRFLRFLFRGRREYTRGLIGCCSAGRDRESGDDFREP